MGAFSDLFARLDPDPGVRGKQFEHICKWFLENDPRFGHLAEVWLYADWPGYWGPDAGVDLIAKDNEGHHWAIQSKAYKDTYWIKKSDVDSFLSDSNRKVIDHRLLIATTDRVGHNAERTMNNQEKPVTFVGLTELGRSQVNWPASLSDLQAAPLPPKEPRDYQIEAVNAVLDEFAQFDRGQMIMACGTGKTLTALFAKEKLGAARTLVLAPSLSLLSQTLIEWTANKTVAFEHLPVCSDETVGNNDSIVMSASELGDRVTTDPEKIGEFLRGKGPRVVFGTYQSSPQIAKAFELGGVDPFDLVVADEAHRTTGSGDSAFSTVLDNARIPALRRLFMTATPRYFTGSVIGAAAALDHQVASMDNEAVYGPVFHRLPFSEAIERGLLTDYQVVMIGVDGAEYREMAEKATWVRSDGIMDSNGYMLAAQIGLAKAMGRYDMRRAISFHHRVERASFFSRTLPEVISWMPADERPSGQIWASYVSGEMSTRHRRLRLRELGTIDQEHRGVLSNARCLTEGVDVPTLDGVVFIDPKRSETDIVQAVGRAIRLAPNKTVGTIVIPVFMGSGEDYEAVLDDSTFKTVWEVVKALRLHDEELAEYLDTLRMGLGKPGGKQPRLPEKFHLDLPTHISTDFARAFNLRLVDSVTAPWMEWFGQLQGYFEDHGTTRLLSQTKPLLDRWGNKQRFLYKKGRLLADRAELLSNLGDWSWEPRDGRWEAMFETLKQFIEENDHARVPNSQPLGRWIVKQRTRYDEGTLPSDFRDRLDEIPEWTWDPKADQWEEWFSRLLRYVEDIGDARVPASCIVDGYPLGRWVIKQRARFAAGTLDAERRDRLKNLNGWMWRTTKDGMWEEWFSRLLKYVEDNGDTHVPGSYTVDGHRLGRWVIKQRSGHARGALSDDRHRRLGELPGWSWDRGDEQWNEGFRRLLVYIKNNGHANVPAAYQTDDAYRLGQWATIQRQDRTKGKLEADRQQQLQEIPEWTWDPITDQWEEQFTRLLGYVEDNGHANVPQPYTVDGYRLGTWVATQRGLYRQDKLPADRIQRLKGIPGWTWDARADKWQRGFEQLQEHLEATGTTRVLQKHKTSDGYPLGAWASTQRSDYRKGKLSADRIEKLNGLGDWTWDTRN